MRLSYDPEHEILYIHFKDGPAQAVKEVEDGVIVEVDSAGEVMGIELWGAKKKGLLNKLVEITTSS